MGKPSSNDLRALAIEHHKAGKSNREIFDIFLGKVSERTIRRWTKEFKDSGKIQNSISTGRPRSVSNHVNKKKVKRLVKSYSIRQISSKLSISLGSVSNIIKELNLKVFFLVVN